MMELQKIHTKIHELRGERVMLDFDLAELYDVPTKALNQAVKRNSIRFPSDFMFQLSGEEWNQLKSQITVSNRSQIVTSSQKHRENKALPFAFTEQGVAMLSGVLRSNKAIQVNIAIMRAFVALRRYALTYAELSEKIAALEAKFGLEIADIHEVLRQLAEGGGELKNWDNRSRIGFKSDKITP